MTPVPVIAASDPTPTGGDWLVVRRLGSKGVGVSILARAYQQVG
jgi:hypothetical protein